MTNDDLDRCYTELAQALDRVAPERRELFLATLALRLLAHEADAQAVLPLIAQAERLSEG